MTKKMNKDIEKNGAAKTGTGEVGGRPALEAVFILDASGSMHSLTQDTIGGFNSLLAEQKTKASGKKALVTTVTFNQSSRAVHDRPSTTKVPDLTEDDYQAFGSTALLDAMGDTIKHIETIHRYARPEDVPEKTLFLITTDGMENASSRYTSDEVKKLVKAKESEDGWEFIFVAANIDAVETGASIGIKERNAVFYVNDSAGNRTKYAAMSKAVDCMMAGEALDKEWRVDVDKDFAKRGKRGRK